MRRIYLDICAQYNIPYFDAHDLVMVFRRMGFRQEEIFQDEKHLSSWAALCMGKMIVSGLEKLRHSSAKFIRSRIEAPAYQVVSVAHLNKNQDRVSHKNSLHSFDFSRITQSNPLHVEIARDGKLIGAVFNSPNSRGVIQIGDDP